MGDLKRETSGKLDKTQGSFKEEAGKLGGDRSTEASGKLDQAKGEMKETWGESKQPDR